MQAGTTDLVPLDEDHVEAELGSAQRCGVPAAAASEDHDVMGLSGAGFGHLGAPSRSHATGALVAGEPAAILSSLQWGVTSDPARPDSVIRHVNESWDTNSAFCGGPETQIRTSTPVLVWIRGAIHRR
ncbi:hypothetical protein Kisp01_56900 [Kineosporia sp. NBRC 101677]|nr:hypothetical protein Kisp01_56900 [Kineosporia sp. NBRC 101677]